MPTTQLERGWMNTNALTVIDVTTRERLHTVLLDEVDLGASNPWAVACTSDGASICVTPGGTHELSVIDAAALLKKLAEVPGRENAGAVPGPYGDSPTQYSAVIADPANDLAFLVDLRRRIRLQGRGLHGWLEADPTEANGPRGVTVVGSTAYIAVYFSDNVAAVDLSPDARRPVSLIPLGPKPKLTVQRLGQMYFHDAWLCFQHWQSCASCHPDARVDGLNWDLMNDGLGNPKNAKSMLLAHQTPPSMAAGARADAEQAVRAGFTHILFTVQPEEVVDAIDEYLKALPPTPSPYLVQGRLSPAARRGKELFFSERVGCARCHPEPLYTDLQSYDVNSRGQYDRRDDFDTPTLIECWRTAPYMHDGHYPTLKELFTTGKHGAKGGDVKGLTKQELDDLIEFVKSL
jgi:cytochrome c peroxidase